MISTCSHQKPSRSSVKLTLLISLLFVTSVCRAGTLSSYAFVNDDGTLRIKGKTIHLHGIYIPETNQTCRTSQRPVDCGSRAALALKSKIQSFVRCDILNRNIDRSLVGSCRVNYSNFEEGEDLSAYLLQRGWAVALPDASFEYRTIERIAKSRGLGVWGLAVDSPARTRVTPRE